jgi:hypothetical protein
MIIYASRKYKGIIATFPGLRICLSFMCGHHAWEHTFSREEGIWSGDRWRTFDMGFFTLETWEPV